MDVITFTIPFTAPVVEAPVEVVEAPVEKPAK
jgi:hypothetical protein